MRVTRMRRAAVFGLIGVSLFGCQKMKPGASDTTSVGATSICPTNYILVPGDSQFSTANFCIAKYEAKDVSGLPESAAPGVPWTNLTRDQAITACASKGSKYSLVDNAHYMTVARNVEGVVWNWGNIGTLYGVSHGLTLNSAAAGPLAASADDNVSCYLAMEDTMGTLANCDLSTFDSSRRVQKLSNGNYIWDLSGNAAEWMSDNTTGNYGLNSWVLNIVDPTIKALFGPGGSYPVGPGAPPASNNMYNFGYFSSNLAGPTAMARGGGYNYGRYAGIYTAYFSASPGTAAVDVGFRCMYTP
jgi:hypothetical protein